MVLIKIHSILLAVALFSCKPSEDHIIDTRITTNQVEPLYAVQDTINPPIQSFSKTIAERISPPEGYTRIKLEPSSFGEYLRTLNLKPKGTEVLYYNGATKHNNDVYVAVIDLPIGNKDLHQCADAVMRLRAEYFWNNGEYDKIYFNFTNGFRVDYSEWIKGHRIVVNGNKTYWNNRKAPANTYKDFWNYMELIFMYAGTASLEKELKPLNNNTPQIGDVIIKGGHPGHAVIIVDQAFNSQTGKYVYLLAQSYMPAQEIQLLKNPSDTRLSPWYDLDTPIINTPEWKFYKDNIKRF